MTPESLTERIVVETPTRQPDGGGGSVLGWAPVASVRASITARGASEALRAGVVSSRAVYAVTVRVPLPDGSRPTPAQRILWGERVLGILAAPGPERRGYLELLCEEEPR